MRQLGQFLVNKNVISQEELDTIIEKHSQLSSGLPDILFSEGYVNPYNLYQAIAEFYGMEFADLQKIPCDINLLNINERETYKSLQLMPWKTANGKIAIAVCDINTEVKNWAESKYSDYYFVITSPFDIHASINYAFAKQNDIDAREMLLRMHPMYSASNLFSGIQSKIFLIGVLVLLAFFAFFPKISLPILFLAVTFFYISTLAFKFILFLIGGLKGKQVSREQKYLKVPDKDLPIYTILVPLYKEDKTLKKLTTAIKNLDYPKSRLDVKLIVEADDEITISAIKALKCERMFEMVKVPYSIPRTKPKACNYALRFARGEYVTIYDAEDIPEPLQLKKALYTFYNSPEVVACVQAKLSYFNRDENLLSRMFTIEYSTLFDFLLFGLEAMGIPIPLGGTSNHFHIKTLNALYAWDPYNVTEDADLGVRIAQKGWRSTIIDSTTLEECPIAISAWIKQRSRWIKGHLQTYFVHMRHPLQLYKKVGAVGFFGVQFFIGAPALIFLVSPVMWLLCGFFATGVMQVPQDMPNWFYGLLSISYNLLFIGMAMQVFYAFAAVKANKWKGMLPYIFAFPFYWVLHSVASFKALWQLITKPHYWEKTEHGVTKLVTP